MDARDSAVATPCSTSCGEPQAPCGAAGRFLACKRRWRVSASSSFNSVTP